MSAIEDMVAWTLRARRLIPREDRRVLLSPPRLVARFLRFAQRRHHGDGPSATADDVRARDPELVSLLMDLFRLAGKHYFRFEVEGVDNVPAAGPVLVVGNHNGGLVPSDAFLTGVAVHDRFGVERPLFALAHDFVFEDPLLRTYASRLGMLRAGHESARHAFAAGGAVLVYPGSDLDTFRPFKDRGRIVLGGRKGFVALALRAGVPIVPVVSAGTHEQFIVLSRGDALARRLHAHAWARTEVLPLVLALPWGLTSGFVPYWPLPAQTTIAFGSPIRWPHLGPADADDPVALERCYGEVNDHMQRLLDGIMAGRRPLLGRRRGRARQTSAAWGA